MYFLFGYDEDTPETFTQDDLNRINKKERERAERAEREKTELEDTIRQLRNQESMTKEEKQALEDKLTALEQQGLSEMEKLTKNFEKERKALQGNLENAVSERDSSIKELNDMKISQSIRGAAMTGKIIAADGTGTQILRMLQNQAVVEEGKVVVKNFEYMDNDEKIIADLAPEEALAKMRTMDEWANLFKDPSVPGPSAMHNRQQSQPDKDISKMGMKEYLAHRKKG